MKVRPRRGDNAMVGVAVTRATPGQAVLIMIDSASGLKQWVTADDLVQVGDLVERVDWWEDRGELAAVMAMLHDADAFARIRDAVYFVEKPWKWTPARDRWEEHGRPVHGEPMWDPFMEGIHRDN